MEQFVGLPLTLRASLGAWRLYAARKIDPKFELFQSRVLRRDAYRCQYCGFQANRYQEVMNLDGDFSHNKLDNLVAACCFCAQCFFLESVGSGGFGGGTLIYAPEFKQSELNSLCHALFCAITNNTGYKNTAQMLYRSLKARSKIVEDKFGEGMSDPALFGQLMIESNVSETTMQRLLMGVCLLPSRAKFREQIEHWAAGALQKIA